MRARSPGSFSMPGSCALFQNVTHPLQFSDTNLLFPFSSVAPPLQNWVTQTVWNFSVCSKSFSSVTGEVNLTKGAGATGIIQMVSSNASLSYEEIIAATNPQQPLFFQLYKHASDATAEKRVREVERLGYRSIWLTVDAVVPGNREKDIKSPWILEDMERGTALYYGAQEVVGGNTNIFGTAGALIANDDRDMTWEKV